MQPCKRSFLSTFALCFLLSAPTGADDSAAQRNRMVRDQIENRNIYDPAVLSAMRKVPRHCFVPADYRPYAYDDTPLPIGLDQTISQPYIVALMTDLAEIDSTSRVLEIGTGSGYQAAVLAEIAARVYTIEIIPALAHRADTLLDSLGYRNIETRAGNGYLGWPEAAPFDAIIVTAAPAAIPQPLIDQLADSGHLVIPVGTGTQELLLLQRIGGSLKQTSIAPVRFVPMTGDSASVGR